MEMFRGALTLYYSPKTCHAVRSNSYKNTPYIIDELEATWESKSFHDRSKMHRRQAEGQHFNGRKMSYNSREQTSTNGSGGCLTKGKDGSPLLSMVWLAAKVQPVSHRELGHFLRTLFVLNVMKRGILRGTAQTVRPKLS